MSKTSHREELPTLQLLIQAADNLKADTLSEADRQLLQLVLRGITEDRDVRAYFWQTVRNRPKADDNGRRYRAAFVFVARGLLGEITRKKVGYGQIAELSRLTDDQVRHAVREHDANIRKFLERFERTEIAALANARIAELIALRGEK